MGKNSGFPTFQTSPIFFCVAVDIDPFVTPKQSARIVSRPSPFFEYSEETWNIPVPLDNKEGRLEFLYTLSVFTH